MRNEVLDDLCRAILDIHVPPIHPRMVRLQRRTQQIVARPAHRLSPGPLRRETVPVLDALAQRNAEIFLNDHGAAEGQPFRLARLHALQLLRENSECIICRIADEEREVDEMVRVRELGEQIKVLLNVVGGIAQGREDEDSFLVGEGFGRRFDRVEVDVLDRRGIDLYRLVVVEYYGGLEVGVPAGLLVRRHVHGRFGGAPAVESVYGFGDQFPVVDSPAWEDASCGCGRTSAPRLPCY